MATHNAGVVTVHHQVIVSVMPLRSTEEDNYEAEVCYFALQDVFAAISAVAKNDQEPASRVWNIHLLTELIRVERALSETGNSMSLVKITIETSGGPRCMGRAFTINWEPGHWGVEGNERAHSLSNSLYEVHYWRGVGGLASESTILCKHPILSPQKWKEEVIQ